MAPIPLIEQFKASIQTRKPARTPSRRSTRSPFKPNFARRLHLDPSPLGLVTLEPVLLAYKQPSLDMRATQYRGNSASPAKRRARSTREAETIPRQPSVMVLDLEPVLEPVKAPLAQRIVLPRLPIMRCEQQRVYGSGLDASSRNRGRFTYEKEVECATSKQTEGSTRIYWKRRGEMKGKPLLLVNFEGIIGDIHSENSSPKLLIREGLIRASSLLAERFQMALFFSSSRSRSRKLLSELLDLGLDVDAAYKRRTMGKKPLYSTDYTQVISDFHCSLSSAVILAPLLLDQSEVLSPSSAFLLYSPTLSLQRRYVLRGVPTVSVLTVVVPSLLAQEEFLCPSLDSIAMIILKFADFPHNPVPNFDNLYEGFSRRVWEDLYRLTPPSICYIPELLREGRILVLTHERLDLRPCSAYEIILD